MNDPRRTNLVARIVKELFDQGLASTGLRAGDVCDRLREIGAPMDAWEVRGELANLEAAGKIVLDADTAAWRPVQDHPSAASGEPARLRDTG